MRWHAKSYCTDIDFDNSEQGHEAQLGNIMAAKVRTRSVTRKLPNIAKVFALEEHSKRGDAWNFAQAVADIIRTTLGPR